MPRWRSATDVDKRVDERPRFISGSMWDVGKMTEDMVGERLKLRIFLDVHHVEKLFHDSSREERYERRALVI